ncbi:hypothetical protein SELMODRAFT_403671 [Selaginella moellendorffii]|uniref:Uncharacterized protein n=2 Tax=Selaginella moellendorffii TaxID=88036 RepID=D8QS58_SELML|nr:hypothetical protein SELMODRAFT_403671 [Selaginella moellendorffii]
MWEALQRKRIPKVTPVRQLLERVFPSLPSSDKERVADLLVSKGICKAADFRDQRVYTGRLVDWGVPQWIAKGLVGKGVVDPSMPKEVREAALDCAALDLNIEDAKFEEDGLFSTSRGVSTELQLKLQAAMASWDSWWHLALGGFEDPEEEALVTDLFKQEEVAVMYGFRALLDTIIREAPVVYHMISSNCFTGSFYFVQGSSLVDVSDDTLDWSKVVWMLQVSSEEIHYGWAVGRMILGVREMFSSQPRRQLAFGVVAGHNFVHVYAFHKPREDEKLLPSYVDKWMFTYEACHSGFVLLVHLLCIAPAVHGFVDVQ